MNNKIVNHFKRNELKYDAVIGFVMIGVSFVSVAIGATKASKIIYAEESNGFAPYKDQNPMVIRIVAQKK